MGGFLGEDPPMDGFPGEGHGQTNEEEAKPVCCIERRQLGNGTKQPQYEAPLASMRPPRNTQATVANPVVSLQ